MMEYTYSLGAIVLLLCAFNVLGPLTVRYVRYISVQEGVGVFDIKLLTLVSCLLIALYRSIPSSLQNVEVSAFILVLATVAYCDKATKLVLSPFVLIMIGLSVHISHNGSLSNVGGIFLSLCCVIAVISFFSILASADLLILVATSMVLENIFSGGAVANLSINVALMIIGLIPSSNRAKEKPFVPIIFYSFSITIIGSALLDL